MNLAVKKQTFIIPPTKKTQRLKKAHYILIWNSFFGPNKYIIIGNQNTRNVNEYKAANDVTCKDLGGVFFFAGFVNVG